MKLTHALTQKRGRLGLTAVGVAGITAASLALTGTADAADATRDATSHGPKPTVVLVHGAFADASSWNGVIKELEHDGYPVVAPPNPLRGVASDAATISGVLKTIDGPVILAGHSYGGSVISEAAVNDPQVKALVYIAAYLPDEGESAGELTDLYPGSTLASATTSVPVTLPDGTEQDDLYIKRNDFPHQFAADVPRAKAAVMAATQRPLAASALAEENTTPAWKTIPSWDLITTQDLNIPPAAQRFMARRAHAHITQIKASHAVAVSHPDATAHTIEKAAHATVHQ